MMALERDASAPLLSMRGIQKRFFGVHALKGVDLEVRPGEVHAVVGENGAGKSTLIKILAGALRADEGEIHLGGRLQRFETPRAALEAGIAVIYQDVKLCPALSVAENIGLHDIAGRWFLRLFRYVDRAAFERRTQEIFTRLGVSLNPRALVQNLRLAERRLVEIAKALSRAATIVVMDEPTASLETGEVEALFRLIRQLTREGTSVIFISHIVEEVLTIADRVTVLRDGRVVAVDAAERLTPGLLIRHIVGRDLSEMFPKAEVPLGPARLVAEDLAVRSLGPPLSFDVREGEILGVTGLLGSGCTELLGAVYGTEEVTGGRLLFEGAPLTARAPREAIRRGIGYVPEDRKAGGIVPDLSVEENIVLPSLRRASRWGLLSRRRRREMVLPLMRALDIKAPSPRTPVKYLSGGNQQKVVLAKWLASQVRLLALDEPTHGVDVGAKAEIHRLMGSFVADRGSILLSSSELPEVLSLSDRILVLRRGEIAGRFRRGAVTQEAVMARAAGMAAPPHADTP